LPRILQRETGLEVVEAGDGDVLRSGRIAVAAPDRHLLFEDGRMRVVRGPKENGHRPSIDVLFRSAASHFGPRVVGVVLTGTLTDGAHGLWAVRSSGGLAVVQDPDEATSPGMPQAVLDMMAVDHCLGVEEIASLLVESASRGDGGRSLPVAGRRDDESGERRDQSEDGAHRPEDDLGPTPPGGLSAFTCPACGGALWELDEEGLLSYRCHVGHGYSAEGLSTAQDDSVEAALYSALRALKERIALARHLGEQYAESLPDRGARHTREADELQRHADVLTLMLAGKAA
jgi:two-component system chemotaxis response regulator CheB